MSEEAAAVVSESGSAFFGHPRGLATLFMTEVWERFSYYGMRALLILFMTAAVTSDVPVWMNSGESYLWQGLVSTRRWS